MYTYIYIYISLSLSLHMFIYIYAFTYLSYLYIYIYISLSLSHCLSLSLSLPLSALLPSEREQNIISHVCTNVRQASQHMWHTGKLSLVHGRCAKRIGYARARVTVQWSHPPSPHSSFLLFIPSLISPPSSILPPPSSLQPPPFSLPPRMEEGRRGEAGMGPGRWGKSRKSRNQRKTNDKSRKGLQAIKKSKEGR